MNLLESTDDIKNYFNEISTFDILTQQEEYKLGLKILNGDAEAKKQLIEHNLKLVVFIAKKFVRQGMELSDLIQEGNLSLLKAVDTFDVTKGYRFSTYASKIIIHDLSKISQETRTSIRIPIGMEKRINNIKQCYQQLYMLLEREPSIEEIANKLNLSVECIRDCCQYANKIISLNTPIGEDKDGELEEFIVDDQVSLGKKVFIQVMQEEVHQLLANTKFSQKELEILMYRFGLFDENQPKTFEEIAQILHLSKQRVRQLETKLLTRLRHLSDTKKLVHYMDNPEQALEFIKPQKCKILISSIND